MCQSVFQKTSTSVFAIGCCHRRSRCILEAGGVMYKIWQSVRTVVETWTMWRCLKERKESVLKFFESPSWFIVLRGKFRNAMSCHNGSAPNLCARSHKERSEIQVRIDIDIWCVKPAVVTLILAPKERCFYFQLGFCKLSIILKTSLKTFGNIKTYHNISKW